MPPFWEFGEAQIPPEIPFSSEVPDLGLPDQRLRAHPCQTIRNQFGSLVERATIEYLRETTLFTSRIDGCNALLPKSIRQLL
jgi:hypothetical protein